MKKKCLAVLMTAATVVSSMGFGTVAMAEGNDGDEKYEDTVTLSLLVDQNWLETYGDALQALSDATLEKYNIEIELENKTNGSEGDNIVKTRLAAGEMTDFLIFNSGAQFSALNPEEYFLDLTDYDFMDNVNDIFKQAVTVDEKVYGTPVSSSNVGGIVYNKKVYEELGLEIPKTWDQFISNMEACEEAGYTGILGTCGDSWSSQYTLLADYYNVQAQEPDFASEFEAGTAKFETVPAALRSWEKLSDLQNHMNEDYMATTVTDGFDYMMEEGGTVHWPMTSQYFSYIDMMYSKEDADNFGIFPIPGDDENDNGFTVWMPNGLYINKDSGNVDAAVTFMKFWASEEGMDVFMENASADGPYLINGVELPEDSYQGVLDLQSYFDEGKTALALEFLTALKGASCDQICVECISGAMSAEEAAKVYDEDCQKMAQQLGLKGWE